MATTVSHLANAHRVHYQANTDLSPEYIMASQLDTAIYNKGSGDIGQMFTLQEGMLIDEVIVEVLTEEGGAATVDCGITGVDVDGWIDAIDVNSAGWYRSGSNPTIGTTSANVIHGASTQLYGVIGRYLHESSTADTIDLLFNTAATAVTKFNIYAKVLDFKLLGLPF